MTGAWSQVTESAKSSETENGSVAYEVIWNKNVCPTKEALNQTKISLMNFKWNLQQQ